VLPLIAALGALLGSMDVVLAGFALLIVLQAPQTVELRTGGGAPGDPQFRAVLDGDGLLTVTRMSLPITREGMLTTTEVSVQLAPGAGVHLVELAAAIDDFDVGCGEQGLADGTNAFLTVTTDADERHHECHDALQWPQGPKTKAFLDALNSHLPESHQVF
jgi:hypothetical protein